MLRAFVAPALFIAMRWISLPAEPKLRLCGFYWITHLPCPFCGLTRGIFAFAKGHFVEAFHWNALTPIGFLLVFSLFWHHPIRAILWKGGMAAFALYGAWRLVVAL